MKQPYIVIERGGWYHAYSSRWAWWIGRESILRARTWSAMEKAIEELRTGNGKLRLQTSR